VSRLLVLRRSDGAIFHRHFRDIVEYLRPGDVLVANETRVIPARLIARKVPSGGKVELLLVAKRGLTRWEALVKGRRALPGQRLELGGGDLPILAGVIEEITPAGGRLIRFDEPIEAHLERLGEVPLPPYITHPLANPARYQTVYAQEKGSVAAPTAGLHFTPELMARLGEMGVTWVTVVLHIGLDTFRPVHEERVEDHRIHTEYCRLDEHAAETINRAKREGRRIIAVGTTSVRVLETAAREVPQGVRPWEGHTDLFIYPGYTFRVVDALITNFHLPRSSLLMLVAAFASLEQIKHAYQEAIRERYRFYSFGDSMFIL
ncbi:MAG: tRNA preQ1(34) S-adenosylmethionine ribosyltransferase-isomerase QueA, partial [Chloroflexi bacterium]|nr:tRNA preQ1(34) S-adenosylmethionine ribosyltransferase-isomerase QueA [Chloroflexota bacterium]